MAPTPRDVTPAEFRLLRRLWERGNATIRELSEDLYGERPTRSQYATVQSLLDRLYQKGYVHRRREGRQNHYSPAVTRSDLLSLRLREIADELCDGSLAPLLSHLTRLTNPTPEEADALQRLVERLSERASHEEDE